MLMSWLVLTNHCALGMMKPTPKASAEHACCQSHDSSRPDEPKPDAPQLNCCKTVKATASQDLLLKLPDPGIIAEVVFAKLSEVGTAAQVNENAGGEHGPPVAVSFAERVLQSCARSHAPPAVL
jgi:hypothetical protein